MGPEKQFEERVKRWLKSQGIYPLGYPRDKMTVTPCGYFIKRWGGGRYVQEGLPDMQIVVLGRCLEVELKAENGKPSKIQQRNIETIREAGCLGYIIYPEDFPALKKVIMRLKGVSI